MKLDKWMTTEKVSGLKKLCRADEQHLKVMSRRRRNECSKDLRDLAHLLFTEALSEMVSVDVRLSSCFIVLLNCCACFSISEQNIKKVAQDFWTIL